MPFMTPLGQEEKTKCKLPQLLSRVTFAELDLLSACRVLSMVFWKSSESIPDWDLDAKSLDSTVLEVEAIDTDAADAAAVALLIKLAITKLAL